MHRVDLGRRNPDCAADQHGDYAAYKHGCRCPHAREHKRIYMKRLRENRAPDRFVDKTGTVRRLQALAVMGWRWQDVGDRLGVTWQAVQNIVLAARPMVHVVTAQRIAVIYRDLADKPGPSQVTRRRALAKGWVSPLAWDNIDDPDAVPDLGEGPEVPDEWAVAELLAGRLTVDRVGEVDAVEAARRLSAEGLRFGQIRYRLRLTTSQTLRLLKAVA